MKPVKLLLISLIITSAAFAQNVSVTDYEVPVSTAKILRLTGGYNWSQTSFENLAGTTITNVTANSANLNLIYSHFYSSLPFAWFIDVNANGGKSFSDYNHDVIITPSIRKYIWDDSDLFGFARLNLRHANYFKQLESFLTLGGGYGRYINATALAKAVRIEEHLIREGVIDNNMPKETLIKIANIIEREGEYRGLYGDTYETRWYEAIEKEVKASGNLIGNNVGAIGILRMQQVLKSINERVNDRYYGWDVTLGAKFNLTTQDKSPTQNPALAVGARYSYPVTWRTQVNAFADMSTPLDSNFFKRIENHGGIDFIYELSNRINFVTGYRMAMVTPNVGDSWIDHSLGASFIFYLENYINLGINAGLIRAGNPTLVPGTNYKPRTDLTTSVTLQYNLF